MSRARKENSSAHSVGWRRDGEQQRGEKGEADNIHTRHDVFFSSSSWKIVLLCS